MTDDRPLATRHEIELPLTDMLVTSYPDGRQTLTQVAANEDEQRASYHAALRRELEGVEYRLAHLDDDPPPWVNDVPNRETVERTRKALEAHRLTIYGELGEKPPRRK